MTPRSIILGLIGAIFVCGYSYFNDNIIRQTLLVANNLPISAYGGMVLFVLILNPILVRVRRSMAWRGRELAVALTLTLAACCIPGAGLMRGFGAAVMLPYHYVKTDPGWKQNNVLENAPEAMLADISRDENKVLSGFLSGLGQTDRHISLSDIPWYAWRRTLAFWLPLLVTLWFGLVALSLVVHNRWARQEQLAYPIATVAAALLPEQGRRRSDLFKNRLFWFGAVAVVFVHANNYMAVWRPEYGFQVKTFIDFTPLNTIFPDYYLSGGSRIFKTSFFFTVIGFAYFLARDVSLALGIGPALWILLLTVTAKYGVGLHTPIEPGSFYTGIVPSSCMFFGSALAFFFAILYTGRHYYASTFARAVGLPLGDQMPRHVVVAARIFLTCAFLAALQIAFVGVPFEVALVYVAFTVLFFLVMSRILAETGLFYMQPYWFPSAMVWAIFGSEALGPQSIVALTLLATVMMVDPRESLMPFMVNSLKLLDMRQVSLPKASAWSGVAILVGLAVAVPVTFWYQYDRGMATWDWFTMNTVPKEPFANGVAVVQKLSNQGILEEVRSSLEASRWTLYTRFSPNGEAMLWMGVGMLLVGVFTVGRLRYTWWPIHPVIFLTWGTEPAIRLFLSFFLGWFIKSLVMKYGGAMNYQRLKPLMIGVIAGEMLAGIVVMIVGTIYYAFTGSPPPPFSVFLA